MCQVLMLSAGVTLPIDKLELTCDINKHGFGLAWVDNGELKIHRSVKQPNDPDEINRLLIDTIKFKRFLHLRHATVGNVNMENSHPFVLLQKGKGSPKPILCMMHNGTLSNYTPPQGDTVTSDTLLFARTMAGPLASRIQAYSGKSVLADPIFKKIMEQEAQSSVLLFFDVYGNHYIVDKYKRGKEYKGYWASNEYSFDPQHFRSSSRQTNVVPFHAQRTATGKNEYWDFETNTWKPYPANGLMPWEETPKHVKDAYLDWGKVFNENQDPNDNTLALPDKQPVTPFSPSTNAIVFHPNMKERLQYLRYGSRIKKSKETNMKAPIIKNLRVNRPTFCELAKINDISEIENLTMDDLKEMSKLYDGATASLIVDLYQALVIARRKATALEIKMANTAKKK